MVGLLAVLQSISDGAYTQAESLGATADGCAVHREGRVMGVLEVSRSIGDGAFKMHGVSSTPDVKKCQLTDNDRSVLY